MKIAGFMGGAYQHKSLALAAQRLINAYPETIETGEGKEPGALIVCPGFREFADTGTPGLNRGMFAASNGLLYTVVAGDVFTVNSGGTATQIGTIPIASTPVAFSDNGLQTILVDGARGYLHTYSTNVFGIITDPDFPNGTPHIEFQDQRFIGFKPDTQTFYISDLLNGASWDTLNFTSAESAPDDVNAIRVLNRELFVFGELSVEPYYDSGDADFPFSRVQGGVLEVGIEAPHSLVKIGGRLIWLAHNRDGDDMVLMMQGYQPQRVSTHAIETLIRSSAAHHNAVAWGYERNGHHFYVLQFSDLAQSLVYDLTEQRWHERAGFEAGNFTAYPATCHALFGSENLVGHRSDGKIYALDEDTNDYAGQPRKWLRAFRPPYGDGKRVFYSQLRLDMQVGYGNSVPPGNNPQVMMRYSDDAGHTWSNTLQRSAGRIGEFNRRVQWNSLGSAYDRVFEVSGTDAVPTTLTGAYMEANVGR